MAKARVSVRVKQLTFNDWWQTRVVRDEHVATPYAELRDDYERFVPPGFALSPLPFQQAMEERGAPPLRVRSKHHGKTVGVTVRRNVRLKVAA